jgi:hypothetical protein
MSNASATTITVNTALFAAGDTVQITNLGAGVCTITAGTATVNSSASLALAQYESGTLDFTSTSASIFIKGQGAAAAVGGQTLLNAGGTTLSGSSVTISSIPATYKDLKIVMINRTLNADGDYAFRFNGDSGSNRYNASVGGARAFNSSYMLMGEYGLSTDIGSYHVSFCFDYALTTTYKTLMCQVQVVQDQNTPANINWSRTGGIYNQLGAINSITVLPTSATSFTGGTIYVYGVS